MELLRNARTANCVFTGVMCSVSHQKDGAEYVQIGDGGEQGSRECAVLCRDSVLLRNTIESGTVIENCQILKSDGKETKGNTFLKTMDRPF